MAVSIPRVLLSMVLGRSSTRVPRASTRSARITASRDGRRFLVNTQSRDAAPTPITVVLNWDAALKK
jgi:hypothetical protein